MLSRRSLLLGLSLPALCGWPGSAARAQTGDLAARARSFVDALGKEAMATMADKSITRDRRFERFHEMFHKGFDVPTIARFVLGRYWNVATPPQQQEYLKQFEEMVVRSYAARFDSYQGEQFRIASSRPDGDHDIFVATEVTPPNGAAVNVEWRVRERDGRLGIIDVVVEGVSMSVTQRQEFASVIQAKGGNIDAFLQALREKNAALLPQSP
jgi:phospholipid transport system substrate-binding protein